MYDYIKNIKDSGFFVNGQEDMEKYLEGDRFSKLYNAVFHYIDETKEYGDIRRINDTINDLEELLHYAKTGRAT